MSVRTVWELLCVRACVCQGPVRGVRVWCPSLLYCKLRCSNGIVPCSVVQFCSNRQQPAFCPISGYTLSSFCHVIVSRGLAAAAVPLLSPADIKGGTFSVFLPLDFGNCAITWTLNKDAKCTTTLLHVPTDTIVAQCTSQVQSLCRIDEYRQMQLYSDSALVFSDKVTSKQSVHQH